MDGAPKSAGHGGGSEASSWRPQAQKQKSEARNGATRAQRTDPHPRLFLPSQQQEVEDAPASPGPRWLPHRGGHNGSDIPPSHLPKARRPHGRHSRVPGLRVRVAGDTAVEKARRVLAPGCRVTHEGNAAAAMAAKTASRGGQAQSRVQGPGCGRQRAGSPRLAPPLGCRNRIHVGLRSQIPSQKFTPPKQKKNEKETKTIFFFFKST